MHELVNLYSQYFYFLCKKKYFFLKEIQNLTIFITIYFNFNAFLMSISYFRAIFNEPGFVFHDIVPNKFNNINFFIIFIFKE